MSEEPENQTAEGEEPLAEIGSDTEESESLGSDHPLFKRLQDELAKQLDELNETIDLQTRENLAMKSKLSAEREQVGVELYSVQQQLAKLQQKLAEANEERANVEADRLENEEILKQDRQQLQDAEQKFAQRTKDYEQQRSELAKLSDVVLQMEKLNQSKLDEVAVVRRETYKSEQSATETEAVKQQQDMYIDKLANQARDVEQQLQLIEKQIVSQKTETKTAKEALLQASLEMERINFERNHLAQEWNSALIGVKRRSETLAQVEAAQTKQDEEIRTLQGEHDGIKQQIREQQDLAEKNTVLLNKIKGRIQFLNGKISSAADERKSLQSQLEKVSQLISNKGAEIAKLVKERNAVKSEYGTSAKGSNQVSVQIKEVEDRIIEHVGNQSNLKRDALIAQQQVDDIRAQIAQKDRELSDLQNEVVRLRIDHLNILAQSEKLERGLKEIVQEVDAKDQLVTQYEMQIRRNNTDIEKRQSEVDKLNRQYDNLKSAQNGEEYGPLERVIRQLENKIQQTEEKSTENRASWLKKQNELVALTRACEEIEATNRSQQAHVSVLSRKRDRVKSQLEGTQKEIERLEIQIKLLQREMSRLGAQLSESVGTGNALVEGNINFEADILENLRKKEEEAALTEGEVERLAEVRERLAEDLMETEKEIMLWEKKLQLAKEMREALDPEIGSSELKSMKKEVSRMELRLKQIKKQQEMIIQEMQYSIRRRQSIANQGVFQQRLHKDKTRADVSKGITQLKRQVQELNSETEKQSKKVNEGLQSQHELATEIEQLQHIAREMGNQKADYEGVIQTEETNRLSSQARLEKLQAKNRMFQTGKIGLKSEENFEATFANLKNQQEQLVALTDMLASDFPHLAETLRVMKLRVFTM